MIMTQKHPDMKLTSFSCDIADNQNTNNTNTLEENDNIKDAKDDKKVEQVDEEEELSLDFDASDFFLFSDATNLQTTFPLFSFDSNDTNKKENDEEHKNKKLFPQEMMEFQEINQKRTDMMNHVLENINSRDEDNFIIGMDEFNVNYEEKELQSNIISSLLPSSKTNSNQQYLQKQNSATDKKKNDNNSHDDQGMVLDLEFADLPPFPLEDRMSKNENPNVIDSNRLFQNEEEKKSNSTELKKNGNDAIEIDKKKDNNNENVGYNRHKDLKNQKGLTKCITSRPMNNKTNRVQHNEKIGFHKNNSDLPPSTSTINEKEQKQEQVPSSGPVQSLTFENFNSSSDMKNKTQKSAAAAPIQLMMINNIASPSIPYCNNHITNMIQPTDSLSSSNSIFQSAGLTRQQQVQMQNLYSSMNNNKSSLANRRLNDGSIAALTNHYLTVNGRRNNNNNSNLKNSNNNKNIGIGHNDSNGKIHMNVHMNSNSYSNLNLNIRTTGPQQQHQQQPSTTLVGQNDVSALDNIFNSILTTTSPTITTQSSICTLPSAATPTETFTTSPLSPSFHQNPLNSSVPNSATETLRTINIDNNNNNNTKNINSSTTATATTTITTTLTSTTTTTKQPYSPKVYVDRATKNRHQLAARRQLKRAARKAIQNNTTNKQTTSTKVIKEDVDDDDINGTNIFTTKKELDIAMINDNEKTVSMAKDIQQLNQNYLSSQQQQQVQSSTTSNVLTGAQVTVNRKSNTPSSNNSRRVPKPKKGRVEKPNEGGHKRGGHRNPATAHLSAEERRQIRAQRNRESAEKSRIRRKQMTAELEQSVSNLREENNNLKTRLLKLEGLMRQAEQQIDMKNENIETEKMMCGIQAIQASLNLIQGCRRQCVRTFREGAITSNIDLKLTK